MTDSGSEPRDRHYRDIILEAQLMARSANWVYSWFEDRDKEEEKRAYRYFHRLDLELEQSLLRRCDPLIDLALAQFTGNREIATALFNRGGAAVSKAGLMGRGSPDRTDARHALRLSVLSNRHIDIFNSALWFSQWFPTLSEVEILALFVNPSLEDTHVLHFLQGKDTWPAMSDSCRQKVVLALSHTPRMQRDVKAGEFNGIEQFYRHSIHTECWALSETVANTAEWASTLSSVFERLHMDKYGDAASATRWLDAAKRWLAVVPADTTAYTLHTLHHVRSRLAEVALACDPTLKADALSHNDDAVRQAAYRSLSLSLQEMREGFERDKEDSYNALVANDRLWREPDKRRLLSDLADDAEKAVGDETWTVLSFRSAEDGMRKDHPDWFVANAEEETPTKIGSFRV